MIKYGAITDVMLESKKDEKISNNTPTVRLAFPFTSLIFNIVRKEIEIHIAAKDETKKTISLFPPLSK